MNEAARAKLERLCRTIEAQKAFLHRVPDPDSRSRAEGHLQQLVAWRDEAEKGLDPLLAQAPI